MVKNEVSIELVQEDEVFEVWTCIRCGRPIRLNDMQKALDGKLDRWKAEKNLCVFLTYPS